MIKPCESFYFLAEKAPTPKQKGGKVIEGKFECFSPCVFLKKKLSLVENDRVLCSPFIFNPFCTMMVPVFKVKSSFKKCFFVTNH